METPRPGRSKAKAVLNPSQKVRVIAKIRGFTDLEAESATYVSVHKPNGLESENVTISFGDQPCSSYELDSCYEQNEGNAIIFTREIKSLISGVFFNGCNATVIASGARGTGKTHVIQGSDKDPGLAVLAMSEILAMAEEFGKSISISCYEIFQDHVYDLLNPKRQSVLVLENDRGQIQLKGLSQVPVKYISEFYELYLIGHNSHKLVQKISNEFSQCHRGLIIHVSSPSHGFPMGKMNFVDMAGYEDIRRKCSDGLHRVERTKVNMSIYALHNVVYALNANKSHVPYRESKLTRMLQDSLGGESTVLMLTCLKTSFCEDSMYMVSLASQSRQRTVLDTIKKTKSSARPLWPLLAGRKLFDEASHLTKFGKLSKEKASVFAALDQDSTFVVEKDSFLQNEGIHGEVIPSTSCHLTASSVIEESQNIDEEDGSPVSEGLQKMFDNLKLHMSSTPPCIEMPPKSDTSSSNFQACTDFVEPEMIVNDNCQTANFETFMLYGSKLKELFFQEYLRILNTGSREDLIRLKGIKEKRASLILELRKESPEPFKTLDDLKEIEVSAKEIKCMMRMQMEELYT